MEKRTFSYYLIILLVGIVAFGTACTGPQRKPQPEQKGSQEQAPQQKEPTISLYVAETGKKVDIALEEYLEGVVAAEMDVNWPLEALAAQAIIARTFTLEKIEEGGVKARGTDASTNIEEFQAYDKERVTERVKEAVKRTRGEVVKHNNKLIKAWFHADGGGQTAASAKEGLGYTKQPTPYIKSVNDPGINITTEENKNWQVSFPLSAVKSAISQISGKDPGAINSVTVAEKGPSGRATKIKFGETIVSGPALRLALGSDKLRSMLITDIGIDGDSLVIKGRGYGHGVGMSQWGARALAEQGKSPEDIVRFFFKDIKIEKIYQ
ncbi:MAG: SpoIID/LytB domain-containing protein [Bacillota bacterium]